MSGTEVPGAGSGASEACPTCRHGWDEHDAMGDCKREDGRTRTGYCRCPWDRDKPQTAPSGDPS